MLSEHKDMKLVYLASPYSHRDPQVILARFEHAARAAVWYINHYPDENVFSPIVNSHILHIAGHLGGDWAFWKRIDTDYLTRCNKLVILCLPGWDISVGVKAETEICGALPNIESIEYMVPVGQDNYEIQICPPSH